MSTQIAFLGDWDKGWKRIGAEIYSDPDFLLQNFKTTAENSSVNSIELFIVNLSQFQFFFKSIDYIKNHQPILKIILVLDSNEWTDDTLTCLNSDLIIDTLMPTEANSLERKIYSAIEFIQNKKQLFQYQELIKENNESLEQAKKHLEKAIEDKNKTLIESRAKLVETNLRIESFRRSLIATYKASSLKELEQQLNLSLAETVGTNWVKIIFAPEDTKFENDISYQLDFSYLRLPFYQGENQIGSIFFMRPPKTKFSKEERDLLEKVSEAASLSYLRIQKLLDSEQFKLQWEATFNAISEPILIVNTNYEILQSNLKEKNSTSNKCFEVLFKRDQPCENCKFGETFSMKNKKNQIFEVRSQRVPFEGLKQHIFANIYTDVTEKLLLENQLMNFARQADLGLVSSSIVHELNNPLAGMMAFAQLLRMELKKDHPIFKDIELIETHLKRCRDIIQNLLNFVRQPDDNKFVTLNFLEIFESSLKLVELQARYYGVKFHFSKESFSKIEIEGNLYRLTQALTALLQKSLRSILEKKRSYPQHKGHIEIELKQNSDSIDIQFFDNGLAEEPNDLQINSDLVIEKLFADYKIELSLNIPDSKKYPQIFRAKLTIPDALSKSGNSH